MLADMPHFLFNGGRKKVRGAPMFAIQEYNRKNIGYSIDKGKTKKRSSLWEQWN